MKDQDWNLAGALQALASDADRADYARFVEKFKAQQAELSQKPGGATKDDVKAMFSEYGDAIPGNSHTIVSANPLARGLLAALRDGVAIARGRLGSLTAAREIIVRDRWVGSWKFRLATNAAETESLKIYDLSIALDRQTKTGEGQPDRSAVESYLKDKIDEAGGFLSQNKCAEIVREKFSTVSRDDARAIAKQLTGNTKQGPRGPRK
ncbi:hypothetical protein [Methylocystis sp. ATCC 49242]|uniref:hypothetical protein n=1 Tax=Methylocystis sp. ATCC 49242 TaxID=622637 RepID=UPI0001F87E4A|nr:hypothetical protein [Methylocystis sp. ATCC 49242]